MRRVVLCRPMGPRNLGTVVRVAANFAPTEVAVVAPERRSMLVHPEFEQMAHGGEGLEVLVFDTLEEALADCSFSVGFTARPRDHRAVQAWDELRERALAESRSEGRAALVFGNEESGLSAAEAGQVLHLAHIPTTGEHTSLNLGMAVGVVLYSLSTGETPDVFGELGSPLVGQDREFLKAHLKDTLAPLTASETARDDLEASIERVFSHAEIQTRDARAWHMLLRALGNRKSPSDYGLDGTPRTVRSRDTTR